jgi:hypothetical protein
MGDRAVSYGRAWIASAILGQMMKDMVRNPVAYCARHEHSELHPYARDLSFNPPPLDCADELSKGCGWYDFEGNVSHLPMCEFRRFIQGTKLDRLRATDISS